MDEENHSAERRRRRRRQHERRGERNPVLLDTRLPESRRQGERREDTDSKPQQ